MAESASERSRRRREAAAARRPIVPEPSSTGSVLEAALKAPDKEPSLVRMQMLLTPEQAQRLKRLAYESGIGKTVLLRRALDAATDEQLTQSE